jgi:hypothetical protein
MSKCRQVRSNAVLSMLAAGLTLTANLVDAAPGDTTRLGDATGWTSPDVSDDGRYVTLMDDNYSQPAPPYGLRTYILDRQLGSKSLISKRDQLLWLTGGVEEYPQINTALSGDARYVAFVTRTYDVIAGSFIYHYKIWIRDRQMNTVELVTSYDSDIHHASNRISLSRGGRYVAFDSPREGLVPGDTLPNTPDVFVYDRQTKAMELVSVSTDGKPGDQASFAPSISADGRYVSFYSRASNLISDDTNAVGDIFVRDRSTGVTTRASVTASGEQALGEEPAYLLFYSAVSDDGRYVAFGSTAYNLAFNIRNGAIQVFVWDRTIGATEMVSVDSSGAPADRFSGNPVAINSDGRFVAFCSDSTNLVLGDTNNGHDCFVRDRALGYTERVSVHSDGTQFLTPLQPDYFWYFTNPELSSDGRFVTFEQYVLGGKSSAYIHEVGGRKVWAVTVSPDSAGFGNQTINTVRTQTFQIANVGTVPVPITLVALKGVNPAQFALANGCPSTLGAGAACSVDVSFRPTTIGAKSAELRVNVKIGSTTTVQSRNLSGTGIRAAFSVSPKSLGFGSIMVNTRSSSKTVTITNTGADVLPINSVASAGTDAGQFNASNGCPAEVASGGSCSVNVSFAPTSLGSKSAQLTITPGGGATPRSVPLAGTGT